jgi:protease-4
MNEQENGAVSANSTGSVSGAMGAAMRPAGITLEREVVEKLLTEHLHERRLARRWGIFFKFSALFVALIMLLMFADPDSGKSGAGAAHTALVEIEGEIAAGTSASAQTVNAALNRAFEDENSVAVILRINSPGGSPVQSGMINDEIARLRKKYPKKPIHVVVEEMCASGGYYIAVAADRIYVNQASIVGSIGVLMDGFGFTGLMDKLGVERRLMTAGENKAMLDPYSQTNTHHKQLAQTMLNEIHQQFIDAVRKGRGKRLKETPDMFSGLFWNGARSVDLGLADGFGTVDSVARDVIKQAEVVDYTEHENWSERVFKRFGVAVGSGAVRALAPGKNLQIH